MKNTNQLLNKYTYIYLCIPTIIFLFGWCKFFIAAILSILLIIVFYRKFKNTKVSFKDIKKHIINNKKTIIITFVMSSLLVYISGIAGYVFQNSDHAYRNALFETLVYNKWPVVLSPNVNYSSPIFLVYYIGFWLPSALVGKIFGLEVAYMFLHIWSVIGVYLTFSYFRKYNKGKIMLPIIMFIFFSGLDIVEHFLYGKNILQLINSLTHLEYANQIAFSSIATQIFWVFNQAIPAWLFTLFILNEKDNKVLGVMVAMSLIFCTLPTIGLGILVLYKVFIETFDFKWIKNNKKKLKEWSKSTFTFENIIVGIPLLCVLALYVKANIAGGVITFGINQGNLLDVLVSIFFEFIIYFILIHKYEHKSKLFYVSLISLLICPLISINGDKDFCMRVSIPGLLILFLLILDSLDKAREKNDHKFIYILTILFVIGGITPLNEFKRTIANTNQYIERPYVELATSRCRNNFFGYTNYSKFYKYIARK